MIFNNTKLSSRTVASLMTIFNIYQISAWEIYKAIPKPPFLWLHLQWGYYIRLHVIDSL